jgi:hypothetical protein
MAPCGDRRRLGRAVRPRESPGRTPACAGRRRTGGSRYPCRVTTPGSPTPVRPVEYKGEPLDAARGPGLGCFRFQLAVLAVLLVLTPLSVTWGWSPTISAILLLVVMLLLLLTGQTMIFLLRLVAAGRSDGRRRPMASATPTVGELEDRVPESGPASRVAPPAEPDDDAPRWPGSGMRE